MGAEKWVESTGVLLPQCNKQGCCCRAASPSVPFHQLLAKAAQGETFARDFFSIFIPHPNHQSAESQVPGMLERVLRAADKDAAFKGPEDIVLYHCRYIGADNTCQIWEDRPQLCRDYPDSPFMVFAPNCAFEPWAKATKAKFEDMKHELEQLKQKQAQLRAEVAAGTQYTKIDGVSCEQDNLDSLSWMLSLTSLYISSPAVSILL